MGLDDSTVQGLLLFNAIRLYIEHIVAFFRNLNIVTHKHLINSYTQETRCGPGVKIAFLWVQEGDGMLQPHLVAVTVFVHSGLPAQPSGFRVRFGKTTSESGVELCRHDSATEWKQQIKLSRVFQRSPEKAQTASVSNAAAGFAGLITKVLYFQRASPFHHLFSFSMLPSTTGNYSNAHKSKIFSQLPVCANAKPSFCLVKSGLK